MTVKILIDRPPVPYSLKRNAYGKIYNKRKKEKEICEWIIKSQYRNSPIADAVSVNYLFGMPIPKSWSKSKRIEVIGKYHKKRPDVDNLVKFYNDCVKGILIGDDAQIVSQQAQKIYSENPIIEIKITNV